MKEFKDYKNFENTGWENMSSLLDQHMPQKKKRFFLLYFTFFLLGILMLISFLSWLNFQNKTKHINNSKDSPIVIAHQKTEMKSSESMAGPSPDISNAATKNKKLHPEIKPRNNISTSITKKSTNIDLNNSTPKNLNSDIALQSSTSNNEQYTVQNEIDQNEIASTTNENLKNESINIPILPGLALTSVRSNDAEYSTDFLHYPEINKQIPTIRSDKFQFGIHAGIQYFTSNKTISYLAGTQVDYKLAMKLSLRLSPTLEFNKGNYLALNDNELAIVLENLDSFRVNTDLFENSKASSPNSSSGFNAAQINKYNTLYNLQLPLTLNYILNKNWQASLGLKLSIPLLKEIISSSKTNIIQWDNQNFRSWKVNPINYYIQTGFTFFPNNYLGISLNYSIDLSQLNSTQNDNSVQGIQTGNTIFVNNLQYLSTSLHYKF